MTARVGLRIRIAHLGCIFVALLPLAASLSVVKRESKPDHNKVVVCYVSTWATYRQGHGTFNLEDIDPSLCTNIIYAFAGLNASSSTIRSLDPYNDLEENYGKGSYKKMTALRKKYPHLSVSVAIGGWNEGSLNYSMLAADAGRRRIFVDSVVKFLRVHNFNGFDLDWEFPAKRGGNPQDKENFVTLVKDLHGALKPEGWLLTAALGAGKDTMEAAYDLAELNKYLDFVHLMSYDYHGKWDNQTGANAPLHSSDPNDPNTVEFSVNYMLENGVSPHKLVLGLAMYGRTFHLQNESVFEMGSPTSRTAFSGPYTQEEGYMGYNEICVELNEPNSSWKRHWDNTSMTPYATSGQKVIVYDDTESLKQKVIFAMKKHLGGLMIWSIDIDDFRGECIHGEEGSETKQKFQLLHSVNEVLSTFVIPEEDEDTGTTTTSTTSTSTSTEEPTTKIDKPSTASVPSLSSGLVLTLLGFSILYQKCV